MIKYVFPLIVVVGFLQGQNLNTTLPLSKAGNTILRDKLNHAADFGDNEKITSVPDQRTPSKIAATNWARQNADTISWWYIKASDTNTVWASGYSALTNDAGRGYVAVSTNRGVTWNNISGTLANLNSAITCITPISSTTAWAGDQTGNIYYTSNRGATWTTQSTAAANYINDIIYISTNTLIAIADPLTQGGPFLFLRTTNGSTWSAVPSTPPSRADSAEYCINRVASISGTYIYAGTNLRSILRSTDQGLTWTILPAQPPVYARSIAMRNTTNGIITGNFGYLSILSTTALTTVSPFVTGSIRTSQFISTASKYVAGGFNGFFTSTDLGVSWIIDPEVFPTAINHLNFPSATVGWVCGQGMIARFDSYNISSVPSIVSFSPTSGAAGTSVTISGTNFGTTQGTSTVRFGTTTASVTSWSTTQIVATVPSLPSGNYTISVATTGGIANSSTQFTVPTTSLAAPSLISPNNNAFDRPAPITLSWTSVSGATSYDVEYGSNIVSVFNGKTINVPTTSTTLTSLAAGTTYLWRVRGVSALGKGLWSLQFAFSTSNQQIVSQQTVATFAASPTSSTDYRLFTFPGNNNPDVSSVIPGEITKEYRIFRDNGGTPPNHLDELKSNSTMKVGEGYWLIKKGNFVLNQTIPLQSMVNGAVTISLRNSSWNIIGSPFLASVQWSDVVAVNGLSFGATLYTYNGSFKSSSVMDPFVGYYYFSNFSTLKIPYPFITPTSLAKQNEIQTEIGIQYSSSINNDNSSFVGIDSRAKEGMDDFERRKPPIFSDQGSVWFERPEWDARHSRFASDIRPALGEGQQWNFIVHHPSKEPARITIMGLENLPDGYAAILIDNAVKSVTTVTPNSPIMISSIQEDKSYSLVIGKSNFLQREKEKYIPTEFQLLQNYPNPFNPATVINYQIPVNNHVSLKIYDAIGREVATLVNEVKEAGNYSVLFSADPKDASQSGFSYSRNAIKLSSGIYFARLQSGDKVQMKKMILIK